MAKKSKNKNRGPQKPAVIAPTASSGRGADNKSAGESSGQPVVSADVMDNERASAADAPLADASSRPDASGTDSANDHFDSAAPDEYAAAATDAWSGGGQADLTISDADAVGDASADPAVDTVGTTTDTGMDSVTDAEAEESPGTPPPSVAVPAFDLGGAEVFDSDGGGNPDDIRGVLIQLAGARLLLPNATIAEVLSYAEPEAIAGTPDWLLGRIRWRGWQLPLIAFAHLAGINTDESGGLGSKVVVLKALGGGKPPYFAVLTQGFPRLVTVSRTALVVDEAATDLPTAILAHVTLNRDDAYLPDLGQVEQLIAEAMAEAA